MKPLHLLLFSFLFFAGCRKSHQDFFSCAKEKGLFSSKGVIPISLDTIKTYRDFRKYGDRIRDTISNCEVIFGFVYNYKDSCFKPNKNDSYNVNIASLEVFSRHCFVDGVAPSVNIYLTRLDSITIYNRINNESYVGRYKMNSVRQKIDVYYDSVFNRLLKNESHSTAYIHIVVSDTIPFAECLLPTLKILLDSYSSHLTNYLQSNYKIDVCSLSTESLSKRRGNLNFRILIDTFDNRKIMVLFTPPT